MSVAFLVNCKVFERYVHPLRLGRLDHWRDFGRESMPVGLGTLFNSVAARIDITILAFAVGSYQTGIYSAAYRIYGSLLNIPIAIFSAVLPAMASFGEKREGVRLLFERSFVLMVAISVPLAITLAGAAPTMVRILYGNTYIPAADTLQI